MMDDQGCGILVVDDSKMMRHVVVNYLRDFGYSTVWEADSVDSARKILQMTTVRLILSDWHMPGGDGIELLKYVRETPEFSAIPFVMVTTERQRESIVEAVKAGVQAFMCKPLEKDKLFDKLESLSEKYKFPLPHKNETTLTEKTFPVDKAEKTGMSPDCAVLKHGFAVNEHETVISLLGDHPMAAELKKIYPNARYVKITDENVERAYSASIAKWQEELKRIEKKQQESVGK
jgi:two-component system chemotaxis response regulator CheY